MGYYEAHNLRRTQSFHLPFFFPFFSTLSGPKKRRKKQVEKSRPTWYGTCTIPTLSFTTPQGLVIAMVQWYLAHKKLRPPLGSPQGPRHSPTEKF